MEWTREKALDVINFEICEGVAIKPQHYQLIFDLNLYPNCPNVESVYKYIGDFHEMKSKLLLQADKMFPEEEKQVW